MEHFTAMGTTVTASFLASLVEVVEAFTIVLAVGITQSWRSAFIGSATAFIALAMIVIVFGPLLTMVPLHSLQYVVGVLLMLFGMRWLRKAILRASGYIALHDEEKAFAKETELLSQQRADVRAAYLGGLAAFKAVLLEGVEVIFIVIAVGAAHQATLYAAYGALAALIVVLAVGLMVYKPLAKVPENTLKFIVGLMLTSFGIFWTGEGLGVDWPGADLMLFGFFVILALFSLITVRTLRTRNKNFQGVA
ncbi:COG4280 domain-containing protein [Allorhizobium sp. BGMRC 0089]|uniref:COG4280 domain-containing protein n=1 Tax=Allorhizobium sonneratiae TaxID=2934936 RepID=UPI00203431D6|nr:COG4280 domain-containing protein [Allorhizobium sonneratiae]MCM2294669.1 COG4280 domain-containing protein [Allorhizobium sonneratiae]